MAADTQLLGKRKKKIPKNPNPLFVKWLTQWKHEAAEKGISLQYTYNKALQSLKKYPLVLETGQDCLILENFGKKLCNMLDEKLTSYRSENNNTQIEINPRRTISQSSSSKVKSMPGNANQMQKHFHKRIHTLSSSDDSDCVIDEITEPLKSCADVSSSPKEKQSRGGRRKEYIPNYRSGAYSILLTLLNSKQSHMTKTDLIKEAQDLCDTSFKTPPPTSHYTAWSSMGILIKKGLILKESSPAKYSLTDAGRELAQKIENLEPPKENINSTKSTKSCGRRQDIQSKSTDTTNDLTSSNHLPFQSDLYTRIGTETELLSVPLQRQNNQKEVSTNLAINKNPVTDDAFPIDQLTSVEFTLQPGTFDIILCVDNCEFYGSSSNGKNLLPELIKNGVRCNLRKLHVGDFLWIAQERVYSTHGPSNPRELVLNYIVERKRMDDLSKSITDGRFREQKFRLKHCGLKYPSYLIEQYGSAKHYSVSEDKLKQAITNTQVIDGFDVKFTKDGKESIAYLTVMSRYLESFYSTKTLHGTREAMKDQLTESSFDLDKSSETLYLFEDFNKSAIKSKVLTVREMFAKQLTQLPNMSSSKALVVVEKWSTPAKFYAAYESMSTKVSREQMLSSLKFGKSQRSIGPILSNKIYQYYFSDG